MLNGKYENYLIQDTSKTFPSLRLPFFDSPSSGSGQAAQDDSRRAHNDGIAFRGII